MRSTPMLAALRLHDWPGPPGPPGPAGPVPASRSACPTLTKAPEMAPAQPALTVTPVVPSTGLEALMALAGDLSPRLEVVADDLVVVDAGGLVRLFGTPADFAARVARDARARGLAVSVVVASTRTAAVVTARAAAVPVERVVREGREASALSATEVSVLARLEGAAVDAARLDAAPRPSAGHYRMAPAPNAAARAVLAASPAARQASVASREASVASRQASVAFREPSVAPSAEPASREAEPAAGRRGATSRADQAATEAALVTLERWGIRTLGQLAALPAGAVHARMGALGTRWHRLARGLDERPLVPAREAEIFEESMALEWPIEGLEPLSFVLARLLDPLCQRLERRDQGATALRTALRLVTREVHVRVVPLPAPLRDPKVLRTLVLLDLEGHPPPAGIDEIWLAVDTAPGRIVQFSLLSKPLPAPEQVSTLMARLTALMGEGRCGSPAPVDTHRPGACALVPFRIVEPAAPKVQGPRPKVQGPRPKVQGPRPKVQGPGPKVQGSAVSVSPVRTLAV
ncbi:MAG: hypothetical protein KJ061_19565, partial [Vicinamibacteraceae bacterium]|nr:hypothetical protein [Vicinamibacteraceae bacterium]